MKLVAQTTIDTEVANLGFLFVMPPMLDWLNPLRRSDANTNEPVHVIGPGHPEYDSSRPFDAQYESAAFRERKRRFSN